MFTVFHAVKLQWSVADIAFCRAVQSWQFFLYHVPRVHVRGGNEICSCQMLDCAAGQRVDSRGNIEYIYPMLKLCRGRPLAVLLIYCHDSRTFLLMLSSGTQRQFHICFATFMEVIWTHDNNIHPTLVVDQSFAELFFRDQMSEIRKYFSDHIIFDQCGCNKNPSEVGWVCRLANNCGSPKSVGFGDSSISCVTLISASASYQHLRWVHCVCVPLVVALTSSGSVKC